VGDEGGSGCFRAELILSVARLAVAVAAFWLAFTIGYASSEDFRRAVASLVRSVGPWEARSMAMLASIALVLILPAAMTRFWSRRQKPNAASQAERQLAVSDESRSAGEIEKLSTIETWVLNRLLRVHIQLPGRGVFIGPVTMGRFVQEMGLQVIDVKAACEALASAGFLEAVEWRKAEEGWVVVATVGSKVPDRVVAKALMSAIKARMEAEGVWQ
jgi:hypothetical protein